MILDAQNHLSWSNTLQSRYTGQCSGRNFLTVASRDPCGVYRARAMHALLENIAIKSFERSVKTFLLKYCIGMVVLKIMETRFNA